jgi:Prokaryotic homologs of the JAB domain
VSCGGVLKAQDSIAQAKPVARLDISPQVWRYLALSYLRYGNHEFLGCMLGKREGDTIKVRGVGPADVKSAAGDSTAVKAEQTCALQGWEGVVGTIHSHPEPVGPTCTHWYRGLQIWTTDMAAFVYGPYPVAAIYCGDRIVWINRAKVEVTLMAPDTATSQDSSHQ